MLCLIFKDRLCLNKEYLDALHLDYVEQSGHRLREIHLLLPGCSDGIK